jgi:hypothetical protein
MASNISRLTLSSDKPPTQKLQIYIFCLLVAVLDILIRYHPSSLATYPNPPLLNIESLTADIISIRKP